jgi:hypothetical protein
MSGKEKRKKTVERPPKDRRCVPLARPTRAAGLLVENQEVTPINGLLVQRIDSQVVRYCSKVGIKNPRRKDEEREPPTDRREIIEGCQ